MSYWGNISLTRVCKNTQILFMAIGSTRVLFQCYTAIVFWNFWFPSEIIHHTSTINKLLLKWETVHTVFYPPEKKRERNMHMKWGELTCTAVEEQFQEHSALSPHTPCSVLYCACAQFPWYPPLSSSCHTGYTSSFLKNGLNTCWNTDEKKEGHFEHRERYFQLDQLKKKEKNYKASEC